MRLTTPSLLLAFVSSLSCTKTVTTETVSNDSLRITLTDSSDTVLTNQTAADEEISHGSPSEFASAITSSFDSALRVKKNESVYSMDASFNGYESSAEATYHYDSALALTYCEVTWNMEGSNGTYTYIFVNDQVDGGKEEVTPDEGKETTIFLSTYRPEYGFKKTLIVDGDGERFEIEQLDQPTFISKRSDGINEYNRLVARMLEFAADFTVDAEQAVLEVDSEVDYGEKSIEKETFRLDVPLYEMLIVDVD